MTDETLGPTLRRLRQDAGLTIRELDHRTGISPRQIENLESGKAANPRRATLRALADVLGAEILVAAFPVLATNSRKRATARKLGRAAWPSTDDVGELVLVGG